MHLVWISRLTFQELCSELTHGGSLMHDEKMKQLFLFVFLYFHESFEGKLTMLSDPVSAFRLNFLN